MVANAESYRNLFNVIGMLLGRRKCILLGNAFVVVGGGLQASALSVFYMIVGCILLEIGIGRIPIALQVVFAFCAGSIMFFLPDTPCWYYAEGYEAEGGKTLCKIFDAEIHDERVQNMKNSILTNIVFESQNENGYNILDLVWDRDHPRVGRCIRISFLILTIQQMMAPSSLHKSAQLLAAIMNTAFAFGTIPLVRTVGRFGRRSILLWSAVVLTGCMVIFVTMIGLPHRTSTAKWTAVGAISIYNMLFGYGWIGICWLYGLEVDRAPQASTCWCCSGSLGEWLFSFITVFAGGIALQNVGWKIWIWMALSCFAAIFFVCFMCPETTGKTLQEIDVLLAKEEIKHTILAEQLVMQSSVMAEKGEVSSTHIKTS
ncbi:sugar transporter stl1 [Fusarium sporotrichioides]|uniref:Sugar transporter stl1 n=1 Tax=Fusarium sporotrichioides TaxID=5514 RepID=A0A395S8J4_FUSSP|nr:sugar transporter stl1 [Fusarium sporotrichioides]